MYDLKEKQKRAFLVFTVENATDKIKILESSAAADELTHLVRNIGLQVAGMETYKVQRINPFGYIGTGQLESLALTVREQAVDIVIFNTKISPRIQRNLEQALHICVIDREQVIIQIFADRAQTAEAKVQAELAAVRYALPRLTHRWTELSQQRGGAFRSRGAGETKLEMTKRLAKENIENLNRKLEHIQRLRAEQRKKRNSSPIKTGAIVGYTNSGKSSLLQLLSKKDIGIEDKLFATLDAQTKRVHLPNNSTVLLTDTVGFVDNLPHELIDAFKSTLEETVYSDFLIIVCDASHPAMNQCLEVTLNVLHDLGCDEKKQIIFVNKIDNISNADALASLKYRYPDAITGSIKENIGIDTLREKIRQML